MNKVEKIVNAVTIALVAALGVAGFIIMSQTAESNKVTVDVAKIQSEYRTRVVQEVALLTAQLRNVEKDMDAILVILKKNEKEKKEKK